MNTASCEVCGCSSPGLLEQMPFDCIHCDGQKTMKASVYGMLLPFTHGDFVQDCNCDQCYVWFKKPGTVTQMPTVMDESEVELLCDYGKGRHNEMVDFLVSLGPAKMFFITSLIHTNETMTFSGWAQRIRRLGLRIADELLPPEEIEELARGVEALGVPNL